jgi:RNA polymerase sigma factor (sigma-70 family)
MSDLRQRPPSVSDEWAVQAKAGNSDALTLLIERHKPWIMKMSVRALNNHADAEDTTQEILWRLVRYIRSFAGNSKFRTWLYRVAVNCVIDSKKQQNAKNCEIPVAEHFDESEVGFTPIATDLPSDFQLMVKEAKTVRMIAVLACLEERQRLALLLAETLQIDHNLGASLMEVSRHNFRQLVARARKDVEQFTNGECSLINPSGSCCCSRKTQRFRRLGYLERENNTLSRDRLNEVRKAAEGLSQRLEDMCAEYRQCQASLTTPESEGVLRQLASRSEFIEIVKF